MRTLDKQGFSTRRANVKIEIYPLDKIVIDGVPVYLGMKQSDVEAAIGKGQLAGKRYYYYNSDMAIDYDEDKKVEFIEFLGGVDGFLNPVIYGVSAFDAPAYELTELLRQKSNGEVNDTERGHSLEFPSIGVGVYREILPSDVAETIEEMKADGISVENNEDIAKDIRRADHLSTIGIGVADYYR